MSSGNTSSVDVDFALPCSGLDRIAISGIESSGIVIPTVYIFQEGTKTVYSLSLNKDSFPQGRHGKDKCDVLYTLSCIQ